MDDTTVTIIVLAVVVLSLLAGHDYTEHLEEQCPKCLQPLPDPEHDPIGTSPGFCSECGGLLYEWEPVTGDNET